MKIRGILTTTLLITLAVLLPSCMLDFEGTTTTDEQASIWTATEYEWPTSPDGMMGYEAFPEGQKAFYKDLYDSCDAFFDGGAVNSKTVTMDTFDGDEYGITVDEMAAVWNVFSYENPRFYWLAHSMKATESEKKVYLQIVDEYEDADTREAMNKKLIAYLDGCSKLLSNASNDLEKALIIHDYILDSMEYAYDDEGNPETSEWAHSIVGAIDRGKGVCETYSKAFQLLCMVNGVTSIPVIGDATDGTSTFGHAWNMIKINGSWYGVDSTWDDSNEDEPHLYFGMDEDNMALMHTPSTSEGSGVKYYFDVPECNDKRISMVYLSADSRAAVLYENPDAALAAMTDSSANYTMELYPYAVGTMTVNDTKIYDTADLFHVTATSSPSVKSILFSADLISKNDKYYRQTLNFDSSYKLNCNLTFENIDVDSNGFTGLKYSAKKTTNYNKIKA